MADDEEHGMSLDDFMRMIGAHVEHKSEEEEEAQKKARSSIERAHLAIHAAIEVEFRALSERAGITDALRDQPDLSVDTAGRGYAQHYLAARLAGVLAKHTGNGPKQEYEALRLEHLAQVQRWIPVIARTVTTPEMIDNVLQWLSKDD